MHRLRSLGLPLLAAWALTLTPGRVPRDRATRDGKELPPIFSVRSFDYNYQVKISPLAIRVHVLHVDLL